MLSILWQSIGNPRVYGAIVGFKRTGESRIALILRWSRDFSPGAIQAVRFTDSRNWVRGPEKASHANPGRKAGGELKASTNASQKNLDGSAGRDCAWGNFTDSEGALLRGPIKRIVDRLAKADPGNAGWLRDLAVAYNKVGDVLVAQGNLPEALKSYRDSLAIVDRLAKADPGNAGWLRDLAVSYGRVATVEGKTERS
jgi:hypothetical protein